MSLGGFQGQSGSGSDDLLAIILRELAGGETQAETTLMAGLQSLQPRAINPLAEDKALREQFRLQHPLAIPREQLDELKKNLTEKVVAHMKGASASRFTQLPPHLLDAKDLMAGQRQESDLRAEAFDDKNLGRTIDELDQARTNDAVAQVSQLVDLMTSELSPSDAGEVIDEIKKEMGGDQANGQVIDAEATVVGKPAKFDISQLRILDPMGNVVESGAEVPPGSSPDQPGPVSGVRGAILEMVRGVDAPTGALPGEGVRDVEATGFHPRKNLLGVVQDALTNEETVTALQLLREHLESEPDRQIAAFEQPSALLWFGAILAAAFFPDVGFQILALPWNVALGDRDRQQAIYDVAFEASNDRWKVAMRELAGFAEVEERGIQRGLDREADIKVAEIKAIADVFKTQAGVTAEQAKLAERLFDDLDRQVNVTGATPEMVRQTAARINEIKPGYIDEATIEIYAQDAERRSEAGLGRKEGLTEATAFKLTQDRLNAPLKRRALQLDVDLKEFNVGNMHFEFRMEMLLDIQSLRNTQSLIDSRKLSADARAARAELAKLKALQSVAVARGNLASDQKAPIDKKILSLTELHGLAKAYGNTAEATRLQDEIDDLEAVQEAYKFTVDGVAEYLVELEETMTKVKALEGGTDVPQLDIPSPYDIPTGYKRADKITKLTNSGKFMVGPGWKFDLDKLYEYGAKGEGGKVDCSGFVCEAVSSSGIEGLEKFPSGTYTQRAWIEERLDAKHPNQDARWSDVIQEFDDDEFSPWAARVDAHNERVKAYDAQTEGMTPEERQQVEVPRFNEDEPSLNGALMPGDLVYYQSRVPTADDSGWHVVIVTGLDKDGVPIVVEARSAKGADKEQVAANLKDVEALLRDVRENDFGIQIFRFSPNRKRE